MLNIKVQQHIWHRRGEYRHGEFNFQSAFFLKVQLLHEDVECSLIKRSADAWTCRKCKDSFMIISAGNFNYCLEMSLRSRRWELIKHKFPKFSVALEGQIINAHNIIAVSTAESLFGEWSRHSFQVWTCERDWVFFSTKIVIWGNGFLWEENVFLTSAEGEWELLQIITCRQETVCSEKQKATIQFHRPGVLGSKVNLQGWKTSTAVGKTQFTQLPRCDLASN